jgi:DNA-binding NarL/FixJ family response regulator
MDLRLPEMNGIEATRLIREEFPNARIAMLTTYSGDVQALRALKVAAMGYVLKGCGALCRHDRNQGRTHRLNGAPCDHPIVG